MEKMRGSGWDIRWCKRRVGLVPRMQRRQGSEERTTAGGSAGSCVGRREDGWVGPLRKRAVLDCLA